MCMFSKRLIIYITCKLLHYASLLTHRPSVLQRHDRNVEAMRPQVSAMSHSRTKLPHPKPTRYSFGPTLLIVGAPNQYKVVSHKEPGSFDQWQKPGRSRAEPGSHEVDTGPNQDANELTKEDEG